MMRCSCADAMLAPGKGKKKGSFLSEITEMQHPRPKRSPSPKPERKEKEEREAVPPPVHEEEPLSRNDSSNTTWYSSVPPTFFQYQHTQI